MNFLDIKQSMIKIVITFFQIPALATDIYGTNYDWQYFTQYNGVTNEANINNSVFWPRAKMLGGSSNINAMIYFRGNSLDYKTWYDAGNKDWSPSVVKECFKKAENLQDQSLVKNPFLRKFYGSKGPLVINTFNSTYRDVTQKILQSWDEIGFKTVDDLNSHNVMGSGIYRATAFNGRRGSTDHIYLSPARSRDNLHVITNAFVTKVLINETTLEASGVEVERDGKRFNVFASTEVILSAGAINTPQILMLSGIGPKEHLESKNIRCLVDLPAVGKYLQDHLIIPVTIYGNGPDERSEAEESFGTIQYIYNQTGPLAQSSISDVTAFYSRQRWANVPEFQNHLQIYGKNSSKLQTYLETVTRYKKIVVDSVVAQNRNNSLYLFLFNLLHPKSMGTITLNTSDPRDYPLIYANYFNDTRDLKATVDGIKMLTRIVKTRYFKSINGFLGRMSWPECDNFKLDSDDYWRCICINMVVTIYHPIGTAKMGVDSNTAVVNSELKVYFVKKLRVIDASVMMSQISGNINGPVIMIAERGANLIKREYGLEQPNDRCN